MQHEAVEQTLNHLEEHGFAVVRNALGMKTIGVVQQAIDDARANQWEDGLNAVGNMWFDSLLARMPDVFEPLVGHPSVEPYLRALMGAQCQLRSLRCYVTPGPYTQEWHFDFGGYWEEVRKASRSRLGVAPVGINVSFYLQDNVPGEGRLEFIRDSHRAEPPHSSPMQRMAFNEWCRTQEHVAVHPRAGDAVLFYSHMPHRGLKERDDMKRAVVVCHYQLTPMHDGVTHLTEPLRRPGLFPFARPDRNPFALPRDERLASDLS